MAEKTHEKRPQINFYYQNISVEIHPNSGIMVF